MANKSLRLFLAAMVVLAATFVFVALEESESSDAATVNLYASDIYYNGATAYASGTVIVIQSDERTIDGDVYEYHVSPATITVPASTTIEVIYQETGDILDSVTVSFPSTSGTNYTVTLKANNTSYGSVNPSKLIVSRGTTYSTNGSTITFSDGQTARAESTSSATGGYNYRFTSWNSTSGTITANKTITANFAREAKSFTVTFDAATNGGTLSGSPTKTVYYNALYGTLPTATKSGYTFKGWYTAATGGNKITSMSSVVITSNQTLYAQFTKTPYTMSAYVANSAWGTVYIKNVTQNTTSSTGTNVTLSAYAGDVVRFYATANTGYHFDYWWDAVTEQDVGSANYYQVTVTGTEDLSANFAGNSYTVTFNATANGGTISGSSTKTVTHGNTYGTLPSATKSGYTFNGWFTATSGGTQITSSSTVTITASQTLYAQFSPGTVTIDAYVPVSAQGMVYIQDVTAGTSTQAGTSARMVVTVGHTIRVYATPSTGYSFDYWWDAVNEQDVGSNNPYQITNVTSNEDLVANFVAGRYTVTFDAATNGGTISGSSTKTVTYGSTYGSLPSATKTNNTFIGWFTAASGGTQITSSSTVTITASQTLYAQFMENSHTIHIYRPANGSISYNGTPIVFTSTSVSYTLTDGTNFTLVATPANGYSFHEWEVVYHESGDYQYSQNATLIWTVDGDVDIKAYFTADSYTVTFDAATNGGTLSGDATKTVTYGSTYGTLPTATKQGFDFAGWFTAATGGTKIIASSTVTITDNQTLYAQFIEHSFTVYIYRPANGSISYNGTPIDFTTSPVEYVLAENTQFTLVATPASGYSFHEWTVHYQESEDFYYSQNATLTWTVDGDVDITASFEAQSYTVTFDATTNGGTISGSSTKTVTYGSTYGPLPSATKRGFNFMGWYSESEGGELITASSRVEIADNHTLYAQFAENTYNITIYRPANGSISFDGTPIVFTSTSKTYTLVENSDFTLTAYPDDGYRFEEWEVVYEETGDYYYSQNATLTWTVDADVGMDAYFVEYTAPDVWWSNDYANGSVEIVFDFTGLSDSYSHKLVIPLWEYNGAETSLDDDPHGLLQFTQTPYTLVIENGYDSDLRVSVLDNDTVVKGPITMRIGNWQQYALEIDAQKGIVYFKGIHNILDRITQPFSFVNYTVTYTTIAADVSDTITGMAIERIYHEDNNGTVHPHFQVSRTTTYLNTYGFVMTDPTINIIEQFPNYSDLRLNFYSFAYYGDTVTINGHTMQVQNADIILYYIPQGTPIYDPNHQYIVGYYDRNVITTQGNPDAKELRTPLSNIYITWNGIQSQNEDDRVCSLTFADSKMTIDMGHFQPLDLTVSFTGVWYFTTALYEPYLAKETSYEMDWWDLSSLDRNGFVLIFDLIIIIGYIVANRIYVPGLMDKGIVIVALAVSMCLLAV